MLGKGYMGARPAALPEGFQDGWRQVAPLNNLQGLRRLFAFWTGEAVIILPACPGQRNVAAFPALYA